LRQQNAACPTRGHDQAVVTDPDFAHIRERHQRSQDRDLDVQIGQLAGLQRLEARIPLGRRLGVLGDRFDERPLRGQRTDAPAQRAVRTPQRHEHARTCLETRCHRQRCEPLRQARRLEQ
jgi:hypothetical protein